MNKRMLKSAVVSAFGMFYLDFKNGKNVTKWIVSTGTLKKNETKAVSFVSFTLSYTVRSLSSRRLPDDSLCRSVVPETC
jgi:hypothetical protein